MDNKTGGCPGVVQVCSAAQVNTIQYTVNIHIIQ